MQKSLPCKGRALFLMLILFFSMVFRASSETAWKSILQEVETHLNITWISKCVTEDCFACMKPCEQIKKKKLSCASLCGQPVVPLKNGKACMESCRFLKLMHTEGDNSSCPTRSIKGQCVLMQPENVEVEVSYKDHSQNFTIKWNGSWPTATVFIVSTRKQSKGKQLNKDVSHDWEELIQTSHTSVEVQPVPLFWHQYRVAAVTQNGSSSFSIPSKLVFAEPLRPQPPRNFRVVLMYIIKGLVQVDISWKKPLNTIALPIHRYRLQWSLRPDIHLDKFISLQVTDKRLKGTIHQFTIHKLQPNRTYVLELQAICQYENRRLRSKRSTLRIETSTIVEVKETKQMKKAEMKRNKIINFKKEAKSSHTNGPTTMTGMLRISFAKISSTQQSQATNSSFKTEMQNDGAGSTSITLLLLNIEIAMIFILW